MNKVLFIAGLSNGETVTEEKGNFTTIEGALSPWQRLLSYCADNGVEITSLSLYAKDGRRWNLPSAGKNPKFHAFAVASKPVSYKFFRKMGGDVNPTTGEVTAQEKYAVAEAVYEDGRTIQLWVDDISEVSWCLLT